MAGYRRFSLRTLVIVMTAFAVWIGLTSMRANRQRRAVETLQAQGGRFQYAHEFAFDASRIPVPRREVPNAPLPGPDWLRGIVGNDYFITPINLRFVGQQWESAEHLALLDGLPNLEAIHFTLVRFRDGDTQYLPRLKKLKVLMLGTWPLPGDETIHNFEFLSNFPGLLQLSLHGLPFEDADVAQLRATPELIWLELNNTHLGDAGLRELAHLSELQLLNASRTRITDDGLRHIAALQNLRALYLSKTTITDAGLAHLESMSKLTWLELSNTAITDGGVEYLGRMKGLRTLTLGGTKITAEGIATLRKALPKANINTKER